jgi:hypothetical protein
MSYFLGWGWVVRPLLKSARRSDLPFLRYGHFVAKSHFIFVMDKLGNFASRKNSLEVLNDKPKSRGKRATKSLAIGRMV